MIRRRLPLAAVALLGLAAACKLDETAGTSKILGDPLLDITLGPAPDGVLPTATHTLTSAVSRDTLTLVLRNLAPLPAGAVYQVYLADSASVDTPGANNLLPVGGRLIRQTRTRRPVNRDSTAIDTRTDTTAAVTAITEADTNQTFTLRIIDTRIPQHSHVVVAVAPSAQTAATRLERTTRFGFLSSRYRSGTTYTASATQVFGSWAIDAARRLPFSSGAASVQGAFRGGTIRLNIRDLIRPPQGWQYAGWLIDARTGSAARLGEIVTPVPFNEPLNGADTSGTSTYLSEVAIIESQLRGDTASAGNIRWEDFTRVVLLLEPKGTAVPTVPGGAFILNGAVPNSVASRSPGTGKLYGTVNSASSASRLNSTIFLTGATNRTPLLVANADAAGAFRFNSVSVGSYRAFVIPPGANAATDSLSFTIGTRTVNGALVGDSVNVTLRIP